VNHWPAWRDFASWASAADAARRLECEALAEAEKSPVFGRCGLCERDSVFEWNASAPPRENLRCVSCACIGRQRAAAALLLASLALPRRAAVYASEHASPFFVALRARVHRLSGSEFAVPLRRRLRLSAWLWRQGCPGWVRHGDMTALAFDDASLDGVISQDVLEHVDDYRAALREVARVLRPGAPFVLTVPFQDHAAANVRIATRDAAGRVVHHGEPEYHGDPVSGGVLCYHHFGWALLDDMREAGFSAAAVRVSDAAAGLPLPAWVLRGIR
jgi:SAM-dependent methyltransferase